MFQFLDSFAKLWKATLSFVMSVRPSVRTEQLGFYWRDFHDNLYLSIFRKTGEKIQILLKSDKKNGYFKWRPLDIFDQISLSSS